MMNRILILFLIIAWGGTANAAPLSELVAELLAANPEIQALRLEWEAAKKRVAPAAALDDPRVGVEGMNVPVENPSLNRTSMTGIEVTTSQMVPFPGKRGLKKKIARVEASQSEQEYHERVNEIVTEFKLTYYDWVAAEKGIGILNQAKARLDAVTRSLTAQYAANQASNADLLKNKIEAHKISERLNQLQALKKSRQARLAAWLNRGGEDLRFKAELPLVRGAAESVEELVQQAEANRPWLKRADLAVEKADLEHRLRKTSLLPDADLLFGYQFNKPVPGDPMAGEDFFSAGVMINIPFWAPFKQNPQIAEARRLKEASRMRQAATVQEVRYQIESLYYELAQLAEQVRLYETYVVPESRAMATVSRSHYAAGEMNFVTLISGELAKLTNELALIQYQVEFAKAKARLEQATGITAKGEDYVKTN